MSSNGFLPLRLRLDLRTELEHDAFRFLVRSWNASTLAWWRTIAVTVTHESTPTVLVNVGTKQAPGSRSTEPPGEIGAG